MSSIMVIDDEPAICTLLSVFLTSEGYWVRTAANGKEGLDSLERGPRPDLVLLDLSMPVMTGRALIEAVRANRSLCDIPVIVLSASAPGSPVMPAPGTFDAFLHKPFDLDQLLAVVRQYTAPIVNFEAVASC